jgi:hypothetical protein
MHARARLPQKRIRTKKPAQIAPEQAPASGKTSTPAKGAKARKPSAVVPQPRPAAPVLAAAEPVVANLAAHRALRGGHRAAPAAAAEIYALAEWIGPSRDSWRRGEIEVHRSACIAMQVTRNGDGSVTVTEIPGHDAASPIAPETIAALACGELTEFILVLPGLRITFAASDLLAALPEAKSAQILAFPSRRLG